MDSWQRIVNDDGTPKDAEFFACDREMTSDVVANTFEQMYGMIWSLAESLAGEIQTSSKPLRDIALQCIDDARKSYQSGVQTGTKSDRYAIVVAERELRKMISNDAVIDAIIVKLVTVGVIDPTKKVE